MTSPCTMVFFFSGRGGGGGGAGAGGGQGLDGGLRPHRGPKGG